MRRHLAIALAGALALTACAEQETESPGQTEPTTSAPSTTDSTSEPTATETVTAEPTVTETVTSTETETTTESTSDDSAGDDAELALTQTCESDRWTVDVPEGWFANETRENDRGYEIPACAFIHPTEQDDLVGESNHYAARIYIDSVAFEDYAGEDDHHVSYEETTVAGNEAAVFEARSEGHGTLEEGEHSYVYIVRVSDDETLTAVTYETGETDYERDKRILDRMMETLQLTG